jgi:hypothetical protein
MGGIYEAHRREWFSYHDIRTKFHKDWSEGEFTDTQDRLRVKSNIGKMANDILRNSLLRMMRWMISMNRSERKYIGSVQHTDN